MKYYKVLKNQRSCHGGDAQWKIGEWMPEAKGDLIPCRNGYHVCSILQLPMWLGEEIWEVDVRGDIVDAGDKTVVRQARLLRKCEGWNVHTARLFSCDCAERILARIEKPDQKIAEAIGIARLYANGDATAGEVAVAWDAVTARSWVTFQNMIRSAAVGAAWEEELEWQVQRLKQIVA